MTLAKDSLTVSAHFTFSRSSSSFTTAVSYEIFPICWTHSKAHRCPAQSCHGTD